MTFQGGGPFPLALGPFHSRPSRYAWLARSAFLLAISQWQEHLNEKLKRSLEISSYSSIYLQYLHTYRHIDA